MKLSKVTKIIMSRIQRIKPELDPQIIEYLMLKDYGDQEMIRLAFGPALFLLFNNPCCSYSSLGPHIALESQKALPNLDMIHGAPLWEDNYGYYEDPTKGHLVARSRRRSTSLPKLFPKACHYYPKGYCKHGVNCCYLHDQLTLGLTPPNSSELGAKTKWSHLPHGQHSIMLVEDALKYLQLGSAKNEMGSNVFGSQHIYFTFPSNSSLDEDDKNPHYICGSHVRVKPQREVLNW
ncbi:unnamed protein product [Spirodela intermedia]|uniref:C3H1-type domain-containing protein n=1 Tax=Spirodela intermedia TaxID=51605 RepID=A0A7I8JT93_SPIIN|nr:unnamed protein product [Spirodela intermedia]CAA6672833.1 unnamed protein product [Spirodela intermedia]